MNYTDITNSLSQLDAMLMKRDEFIRSCAELLLQRLTSAEFGFPSDEVCLQAVSTPIDDKKGYHPRQLPTDDPDGRRGFRIRFVKTYNGYLCGVVLLVPWVFSVEGDLIVAQISGESETSQTEIDRPCTLPFIDGMAKATVAHIKKGIEQMTLDPSIRRAMGFHQLIEED